MMMFKSINIHLDFFIQSSTSNNPNRKVGVTELMAEPNNGKDDRVRDAGGLETRPNNIAVNWIIRVK